MSICVAPINNAAAWQPKFKFDYTQGAAGQSSYAWAWTDGANGAANPVKITCLCEACR